MTRGRLVGLLVVAAIAGCGDSTDSSPAADVESTIESFNEALIAGDGDRACSLLTPTQRGRVLKEGSCDDVLARQQGAGIEGGETRDLEISGDLATARLVNGDRSVDVELEKVEGSWRVRGIQGVRRGGP